MQAIDDAFAAGSVRVFLQSLQNRNRRIRYIEEASSDLSPYFAGGAFQGNAVLETNFIDPYQGLDELGRQRVENYYGTKVEDVEPALKNEFAKVFRN
jgi:hypothetical protein